VVAGVSNALAMLQSIKGYVNPAPVAVCPSELVS